MFILIFKGLLQKQFAAGFIQREVQQHQEGVKPSAINVYTTRCEPFPKVMALQEIPVHVMWACTDGSAVPNHIIPIIGKLREKGELFINFENRF